MTTSARVPDCSAQIPHASRRASSGLYSVPAAQTGIPTDDRAAVAVRFAIQEGETWRAIVSGWSEFAGEYRIVVLLSAQTTERRVFGRLCGILPGDFQRVISHQLRAALVAALSGDDE